MVVLCGHHLYIYIYGWVQVTRNVPLSNVTLKRSNNLLLNLYFENSFIGLHILYVLNMYANFHTNWMLFIIRFINPSLMHYFKL